MVGVGAGWWERVDDEGRPSGGSVLLVSAGLPWERGVCVYNRLVLFGYVLGTRIAVRVRSWFTSPEVRPTSVLSDPISCPGEPGPHGQNWRPPRSEESIFNRSNKLLGTHPLNWLLPRPSTVRLKRLPKCGGISSLNCSREGSGLSGWRGCPTAAVSSRSTGYPCEAGS